PPAAGRHGVDEGREHRRVLAVRDRPRAVLPLADDQPVLRIAVEGCRHERPRPLEAPSVQADGQAAVALLLDQLVGPAPPDLDGAGAVVALWDLALEGRVVERMVLDVDGERALAGLERNALRDG